MKDREKIKKELQNTNCVHFTTFYDHCFYQKKLLLTEKKYVTVNTIHFSIRSESKTFTTIKSEIYTLIILGIHTYKLFEF